ncbi:MAG: hypothetical protein R3F29_09155 [Planctomycetota bacterium]
MTALLLAALAPAQSRQQAVAIGSGPLLLLQQAGDGGADEWLVADLEGTGPAHPLLLGAHAMTPLRRIDHAHLIVQRGDRVSVLDLRRGRERNLAGRSVLAVHGGVVRLSSGPDRSGHILEQPWSTDGEARPLCEREWRDLHVDGDLAFGSDPDGGGLVQVSLEDGSHRALPGLPGTAPRFALSTDRRLLAVGTLEFDKGQRNPAQRGWVTVIDLVASRIVCQLDAQPGSFQAAMHVRWHDDDAVRYACATGRGWNIPLQCVTFDVRTEQERERNETPDTVAPLRDVDPLLATQLADAWLDEGEHGAFLVRSGELRRGDHLLATNGQDRVMLVDDRFALVSPKTPGPCSLLDAETDGRRQLTASPVTRVFVVGAVR